MVWYWWLSIHPVPCVHSVFTMCLHCDHIMSTKPHCVHIWSLISTKMLRALVLPCHSSLGHLYLHWLQCPTQPTIMYTVCTSECTLGTHLQQIAHESPYFSTQLLFTLILHFSVYHLCFSFLLSFALCQATPVTLALVPWCSFLYAAACFT